MSLDNVIPADAGIQKHPLRLNISRNVILAKAVIHKTP